MQKPSKYKPLLFTTTMRSPERLKKFLHVLKDYNGCVLDDQLAEKIAGDIIKHGLYEPKRMPATAIKKLKAGKELTDLEVAKVLKHNPQNHKETGFSKGWPSRFDTWFKFAKELGVVFYKTQEAIRFSKIGLKLADNKHAEFEQQAFLNAFVKYQSSNPFRRVLNDNVPLVLLLKVISMLNSDHEFNSTGISRQEIPLLIYWKDSDAEKLYLRIKQLRQEHSYSPSDEVIIDICREEIMLGQDIARNNKSITSDYPDDFIRKMRLTGLISLRGGGRFIDINKNECKKVKYVLQHYSDYEKHTSEEGYFKYISRVDNNLISLASKPVRSLDNEKLLAKWVGIYPWKTIKAEMMNLSKKALSKDKILKYLSSPVRLEFLTALAIKSKFPSTVVIPNYPVDDEGLPTSVASGVGDKGDIECYENNNGILIEVTMSVGRVQTVMEVWPIARHLRKFKTKNTEAICYFIAPSIYTDSISQIGWARDSENLIIHPKTIGEFLALLEECNPLYPGLHT